MENQFTHDNEIMIDLRVKCKNKIPVIFCFISEWCLHKDVCPGLCPKTEWSANGQRVNDDHLLCTDVTLAFTQGWRSQAKGEGRPLYKTPTQPKEFLLS